MDKTTIDALAERLELLEDDNRRLRRRTRLLEQAGLAVALAGAAGLLIGAAQQRDETKTIAAERFVIKGQDGKIYAELGLYRDSDGHTTGATRLAFFDGNGRLRTNYGVGSGHDPYLHLLDQDGKMLGSMSMSSQGWTSLDFVEPSGKTGVSIGSSNASGVVLRGPDGSGPLLRHEGALIVQADGEAMLHFFRSGMAAGGDRHERVRLGVRPDGTAGLDLRGADYGGGIRAAVPSDGRSHFSVDGADIR